MKKQKGITLIALIITIIVMLILVTVTVTTAINGGLFESTRKASKDTQKQSVLEELNALTAEFNADLYANPDKYYNDEEELVEIIMEQTKIRILGENNENPNSSVEEDVIDGYAISFVYKGTNAKWKFVINPEEGTIDYIELILNGITIQEIGETPTINAVGNIKEVKEGVPIPKGFYYVTGTKNTGVVISDNQADENKADGNNGNQFVWVPVKLNPKLEIVIDDTKKVSKVTIMDLQDYNEEIKVNDTYFEKIIALDKNTLYEVAIEYEDGTKVERFYITDSQYEQENRITEALKIAEIYYGGIEKYIDTYKEENYKEQTFEFKIDVLKKMFKDQADDNGEEIKFYDTTDNTPEKDSVLKYGGFYIGRYEIGTEGTTKKGNTPKTNISFKDAKLEAEAKYNNNNEFGVKSNLPSGSAWNSTANWIVNSREIWERTKTWRDVYLNSEDWGNYEGGLEQTGSNDAYSKNNIYDLAGNLQEWTMETNEANEKICRGSSYGASGSPSMMSHSLKAESATDNKTGYRLMLYIIKE